MKIRLTCDMAGARGYFAEGEVHDFPEDEARRLIASKVAEPADDSPQGTSKNIKRNRR